MMIEWVRKLLDGLRGGEDDDDATVPKVPRPFPWPPPPPVDGAVEVPDERDTI